MADYAAGARILGRPSRSSNARVLARNAGDHAELRNNALQPAPARRRDQIRRTGVWSARAPAPLPTALQGHDSSAQGIALGRPTDQKFHPRPIRWGRAGRGAPCQPPIANPGRLLARQRLRSRASLASPAPITRRSQALRLLSRQSQTARCVPPPSLCLLVGWPPPQGMGTTRRWRVQPGGWPQVRRRSSVTPA
jgi:hypothetical protein